MAQSTWILSPEMRLVAGDPFTPNTKDKMGNPKVVQNGPNKGQPTQDYPVICAIAKSDPLAVPFLKQIMEVARAGKPALFPRGVTDPPANFPAQLAGQVAMLFGCTHPNYFSKIQDGDGYDGDGKPNSNKEGYAGHWIVNMKQPSAPKVFKAGEYHDSQRIDIDKTKHGFLKRGYRVRVNIGAQDNGDDARPGLYLNPSMVEITRPDTEITSGPDANQVFGGGAAGAGAGALVGTGKDGQTVEALRAAGWSEDQMIQAGYAVRSAPPTPPPATNPPPPPVPAGLVPTGKDGQTIEALRAAGWSDDQMVQGGYAVRPAPAVPPVPPSSVSPSPAPPAPTPGASMQGGTPVGGGAPPPPATPSPSSPPPPPYNGYMTGGSAAPPPPAPGKTMLPAAQGIPYDQYIAQGWTDAMLVQHGMMQA